jgi:hypothetical protein
VFVRERIEEIVKPKHRRNIAVVIGRWIAGAPRASAPVVILSLVMNLFYGGMLSALSPLDDHGYGFLVMIITWTLWPVGLLIGLVLWLKWDIICISRDP